MKTCLAILLCLAMLPTFAQPLSDGPYLQLLPKQKVLMARWVCDDVPQQQEVLLNQSVPVRCGYNRPIKVEPLPVSGWQFQSPRFAAISDIHGQYDLMLQLLKSAGIIDAQLNWSFGRHHLVVVGDVMDRGEKVTEALWLLYELQQQARKAGGALHLLPGNHETMVLRGDLRYVHPKYLQLAKQLDTPLPALYGPDTVLGQWLRQLPLFVRINDTLFVHGGLSPEMANRAENQQQLLQGFQQSWGLSKPQLQHHELQQLLQGSDGPLWYRGYFKKENSLDLAQLRRQLASFGASQIVVGHTSMDDVYQHHGGLVYSVDSSIKKGKSGAVLHFIDGKWFRSGLDGKLTAVQPAPEKKREDNQ